MEIFREIVIGISHAHSKGILHCDLKPANLLLDQDGKPGLVIAIEPMVNMGTKQVKLLKDQWTQVTADGAASAHFEHTVAITDEGPVALTRAPTAAEAASLAG